MKQTGYIAFRCMDCGMINVFPSKTADGNVCMECKGFLSPMGYARMKKNSVYENVTVQLNHEQLEEIIKNLKANKPAQPQPAEIKY